MTAGCAVLLLASCKPGAQPTGPPNLLLITLDTTRTDALGVYGNQGGHSPHIDRLAANSVVFERAIAPMGTTIPSHATLFTGLLPSRHGVRSNADSLGPDPMALAARLVRSAYDTAAFVSYKSMLARAGLNRGFETFSDPPGSMRGSNTRSGDEVNQFARHWLRMPRSKPFFLWLHYFEPHAPYRLTPYAANQFGEETGLFRRGAPVKRFYQLGGRIPWNDSLRQTVRVLYDGEVREVDRLVGEVLELLEASGLADNTIVILTADHGQLIGVAEEGDRVGHPSTLAEAVMRVPLVIRDPRYPGPARIPSRVGLVDLAPTLLDLAGAPLSEAQLARLDGRSIAPAIRGEALADRTYHVEVQNQIRDAWDFDATRVAAYSNDLKFLVGRDGAQLFDLASDPRAVAPLKRPWPESSFELKAAAEEHRNRLETTSPTEVNSDVEDELRALGYIQ